jgi:stage IV sporulation protein B
VSGSPIIQNGKLIGDPTRGYAIFAENMLETAQSVSKQQLKQAS